MPDTETVTILFTDVVGSVELRASRGDESAHKVMEAHFELVRREIERHSGQEVKTMGDGFMVAFTSARRAVDCAVALQQALADHNQDNPEEEVQVRIGLNTGEAIEKEGDLFGTAVDAAARIMSKAAGGQILVSESVRSVIGSGSDITLLDRGPFWLKGFPERWRLYEVLWQGERESVVPAPPRMAERTPFVGRENERADLRRYLERAKAGRGSLVMVGGEPGVGKTRITEELVAEALQHGFLTLTGHCYEMEGAPPYIPFIEILQSIMRVVEQSTLLDTLSSAAPEAAKLVPDLREMFPDIPEPRKLPPEQERLYLFKNVCDFFERLGDQRPLVLVFEDLHWADESTMLFLQHLAHKLAQMPLLSVGTYRDTELDVARSLANALEELLRQRLAHDLILRRLPEADVAAMLSGHSDQKPPARLVGLIYRETEGIPFFVEEIYKHFAEEGKLFDETGGWRSDVAIGEAEVPRGVKLVIGRRLERVSEQCRNTLTAASIIGRGFSFDLLEDLVSLDEEALFDAIDEAEQAQLIRSQTDRGKARFIFSHELIRQTLVGGLSLPRRQRAHLRVAESLERLHFGVLEEHSADLAYHYYQAAGDPEKVINYSVMAAERATAQTAYGEAVTQYLRALQALEQRQPVDKSKQCDLLLLLGHAFGNAGDPIRAKETLLHATEIARKLQAPEQFAEAVVRASRYWQVSGTIDNQFLNLMHEGLRLLGDKESALRATLLARLAADLELAQEEGASTLSEQALVMARSVGDPKALYYALYARAFIWDRPLEERIADAAELSKMEEEVGSPEGKDWGLNFLCYLHRMQGDFAAADADLAALKRRAAETSNPDTIWLVKFAEGTQAQMMGHFAEAERLALETFSAGQKVNEQTTAQMVAGIRYLSLLLQGRLADADEELQDLLMRYPHFQDMPMYRIRKAWFNFMLGRKEQAKEEFERLSANNFAVLPRNWSMLAGLLLLSEIATWLGDTHHATQLYDLLYPYGDCVITAGINGICSGAASHWLGLLAGMLERWDEAVEHFESAIETNDRIGAQPWLAQSQHEYAHMLIERNAADDKDKARELLTEAASTYRELGMPTFLEKAEELLKSVS